MNAFLLQDIPADVAEYAARTARRARRGVNEVLVDMLARAIALETQAHAAAEASIAPPAPSQETAPTASPVPLGAAEPATGAADALQAVNAPSAEPLAMDPEDVALREAMLAAQSIPRG